MNHFAFQASMLRLRYATLLVAKSVKVKRLRSLWRDPDQQRPVSPPLAPKRTNSIPDAINTRRSLTSDSRRRAVFACRGIVLRLFSGSRAILYIADDAIAGHIDRRSPRLSITPLRAQLYLTKGNVNPARKKPAFRLNIHMITLCPALILVDGQIQEVSGVRDNFENLIDEKR